MHFAARGNGEPISNAYVQNSANEIIAKRVNKPMRWNRATVHPSSNGDSGAERYARGRLPSLLSWLPPRKRRRNNRTGVVMNPTGLHALIHSWR